VINNKGQSLIEALIALSASVAIISAITVAIITSVSNADFSKNQNLASQYAQQGIEILKEQSRSDWASFSNYSGDYCLPEGSTTPEVKSISCPQNISNFFVREISISEVSATCSNGARVTVSVSWTDGKCTNTGNPYCHKVSLDSCYVDLNSKVAP
jgi:Tfp pilus assembly protein PilV